ncbi:hypothetical protein EV174_002732 [Coemansia sp. RSA 2320]|nr:hypothetical protein EV174_002732 [Coemansia sp. RSA 2320]
MYPTDASTSSYMSPYHFQLPLPAPQPHPAALDEGYTPTRLASNRLPGNGQLVRPYGAAPSSVGGHVKQSEMAEHPPPPPPPAAGMMMRSTYGGRAPQPPSHHHHHHHQYAAPYARPTGMYHAGTAPAVEAGMSQSPSSPSSGGKHSPAARKRSRHAWPADMTRQIINVLLDEFLHDPSFRTTIYRSREERDHRFVASGRSILEEYNKVQNIRRRYFIPLSYLLQWDQLRKSPGNGGSRSRQRGNIEKKLAKPLERSRLQMIFCAAMRTASSSLSSSAASSTTLNADMSAGESDVDVGPAEAVGGSKPVFELDIFVTELKRRDPQLWAQGSAAFHGWVSRKSSIEYIINH